MKRVLILNYEFPPLGGGAGNATYYLLKEYADRTDVIVDLVTSSVNSTKTECFAPNITIHYLNIGKKGENLHSQSLKNIATYSCSCFFYCRRLKETKKFDIVHAFFGIPSGAIAYLLHIPYIVSLRGSDVPFYSEKFKWFDETVSKWLSPYVWKKAQSVIANSTNLRDLALQSAPEIKISVIRNGIDSKEFYPAKKQNKEFTIISSSRLTERKGLEFLMDAFIHFNKRHPYSRLIIAGEGYLESCLKKKSMLAGCEGCVDFLGAIPHEKMSELYRKGDVFVIPSLNEGMSNSLLEAMSSGLAIITTRTGGVTELLGEQCIVVEKGDSVGIQQALTTLATDVKTLSEFKQASREQAEKLDWRSVADAYVKAYFHKTHSGLHRETPKE